MAGYQIKRTVGEHYEDTSYSCAKSAIAYLKTFVKAEAEAKEKVEKDEKVETKKKEKTEPEKVEEKEK